MEHREPITLKRDCEAVVVPMGNKVTLPEGAQAHITQSLGGSYTVVVNGNMFRIEGKDADALGMEPGQALPKTRSEPSEPVAAEEVEKQVWEQMRSCYDPEIPVNIVDLGLIYDCRVTPAAEGDNLYQVDIKMTLTAPGCGMGEYLRQDVHNKVISLEPVEEANVELVWEPQWNQGMMSEAAQLQLGLM